MIGLRPEASALYLQRPRLLAQLPEERGFVVWLEAPYGYGKSVLSGQWADGLERAGWRVRWLVARGNGIRGALAESLGRPYDTPWPQLRGTLWREATLLVLEDLDGREELGPLLEGVEGLLLLASRRPLPWPELLRLRTQGRLVHLGGAQLAFTPDESRALVGHEATAQTLWRRTHGWPLPLHFAALTGEVPDRRSLMVGVREGLGPEEWQEALLLAAIPYLPGGATTGATETLARAGFVQSLEHGYRLHPLAAESLQGVYPAEMRRAVAALAGRLPLRERGEAYRRVGLLAELDALLASPLSHAELHEVAHDILVWDGLLPGPAGDDRRYNVAVARLLSGSVERGANALLDLGEELAERRPHDALYMLGLAAYDLAAYDLERALRASELGTALLARLEPAPTAGARHAADLFLNNAAWAYRQAGEHARAAACYRRALAAMAPDREDRVITLANLAYGRWLEHGDLEGYIVASEAMLPYSRAVATYNLADVHLELGRLKRLLGRVDESLEHFDLAREASVNPTLSLEAQAEAGALRGDAGDFPRLLAEARRWAKPQLEEKIVELWGAALLRLERPQAALQVLAQGTGFAVGLQRARAYHLGGRPAEADASLPAPPEARDARLRWHAARYELQRRPADLDAVLDLTLARERILPGLLPLAALPRGRPELAAAYPLTELLASDWKEAIAARRDDIPPLELQLFGRVEARVLGRPVELTDRHKELLVLLAMGLEREALGEAMWPEGEAKKVRNNLGVQLTFLRKALEPWGVSTYLLEGGLGRTRSDLWEVQRALAIDDGNAVVRLYRPPFAPGVDLPLVDAFRQALQRQVVDALERATASAAEPAHVFLERLLDLDPLHEEALQRLLTLLVGRGRRREALRRYRAFARQLAEEVALEPLPETWAIVAPRP